VHSEVLIRQLEYLVALARARHFGRAARLCYVSQPTLSGGIGKLETNLGVMIVRRGRRFEGFTKEGMQVVGWAHRILAERDALLADIDRMHGGLTATVRIGAIPTAIPATPLISERFSEHHPLAGVQIVTLPSREIHRGLAEFELDAGVTYLDDETPPGTRRIELFRERYLLLLENTHETAATDIVQWEAAAELPLCVLTSSMRNRRILDAIMASVGARIRPAIETDTVCSLYAHVATRRLPSIVTHTWLHAFGVPNGMCVRPLREISPRPVVGLIMPERNPPTIIADALAGSLRDARLSELLDVSLEAATGSDQASGTSAGGGAPGAGGPGDVSADGRCGDGAASVPGDPDAASGSAGDGSSASAAQLAWS
jgi:DNA-binding transcriptional LysR family regulator